MKNPYQSASAAAAGRKLYAQNCAQCHGSNLRGIGPAPALDGTPIKNAKPGEIFWFITKGKLESGMPSWASLPQQQRWQIVLSWSRKAPRRPKRSKHLLRRKSFTTEGTEVPVSVEF